LGCRLKGSHFVAQGGETPAPPCASERQNVFVFMHA
jgi:hypothetical protein